MTDAPRWTELSTPIGPITLVGSDEGLEALWMDPGDGQPGPRDDGAFVKIRDQLEAYFAGERTEFDVPLRPKGTPFQLAVWEALKTIPYGETRSYLYIAQAIDRPKACRAVGLANGRNPLSIIVPCHRVIGANGKLVGYGGGLDRKAYLLDLERRVLLQSAPVPG